MIKVGDFLLFNSKHWLEQYGHNRPVEVTAVSNCLAYGGQTITVRCWEAELYVGQKEHQIEKEFHQNAFKLAGPWLGGDDGFQGTTNHSDGFRNIWD